MIDAEEKSLQRCMKLKKKMDSKRPFANKPLTQEEFSEKYWMNGEVPYQYHTVCIEDGCTEKEQLMLNNIRALKNSLTEIRRMLIKTGSEKQRQLYECKKQIKCIKVLFTAVTMMHLVMGIVILKKAHKFHTVI